MKITKFICLFLFFSLLSQAQVHDKSWRKIAMSKDVEFFKSDSAKKIAENVLLYQREIGGWPKNTQMQKTLTDEEKTALLAEKSDPKGCTTDNGATFLEMHFLSSIYKYQADERYKKAFLKALDYLLEAQYDNGGWPQFYPLKKGYYSQITYNDDSMDHVMEILRDLMNNSGRFSIQPDAATIERCKIAYNKGIDVILKTQYIQNGVPTVWCAQHDTLTFLPTKARAYELPSLSGQESAGLVLLLMSVENPSPEIIKAVDAAVAWFEKTKIVGYTEEGFKDANGNKDRHLVPAAGEVCWARFMELEDNKPFFCGRDGVKKYSLEEIEQERRAGYRWYSDAPAKVLKKYPEWKAKVSK